MSLIIGAILGKMLFWATKAAVFTATAIVVARAMGISI
ncbi:hypothetical protein Rleg2_1139 [Rhizobium leguminosarum bv. trifolii WSM2304]|uniref:Uncharacterized protein n=1 Tax=Rhizobium leguminosarum bv. trifolii (strain WSM2304) TaxID=395492 RepID=A0ABF7QK77_RHILW|nr:hypothetical protein Rleg2_1139 [Rhizobium leguminosarum bv. trifolii WSM2304]